MGMADAERLARERLGLFDKPEPPPTPAQTDPSLFRQFVGAAAPYMELLSAPLGLGLSGVTLPRRLPGRPSAPFSPSRVERQAAEDFRNIPASSPALLRGLTPEQRRMVQGFVDRDPGVDVHAVIEELGFRPRTFDINRFRPPERGRTKPGMSAVQREVSQTYGEPGQPGPGYGELGNFLEAPVPGQMQRPPSLSERISQVPNPARRMLGYEMPIGEIEKSSGRSGGSYWRIPYQPEAGGAGYRVGAETAGEITAEINRRTGAMQIRGSNLPQSAQGQGIGQEMYRRIIDEAHREGRTVLSDDTLSPFSNRIYERVLTGQGYDVKRNPHAENRGYGRYPHTVDEGGVWSVGPKEQLPAPSLMDMLMRVPKTSPYAIAPMAPLGAQFKLRGTEDENY